MFYEHWTDKQKYFYVHLFTVIVTKKIDQKVTLSQNLKLIFKLEENNLILKVKYTFICETMKHTSHPETVYKWVLIDVKHFAITTNLPAKDGIKME